jgi:hypothetical protein
MTNQQESGDRGQESARTARATRALLALDHAEQRLEVIQRIHDRISYLARTDAAAREEVDNSTLSLLDARYAVALARLDLEAGAAPPHTSGAPGPEG